MYTYSAGTTTPLATYSEVTLTTANANPVVCDAAGRATIFLSATSYKWILKTPAGVTIWTRDNVGATPANTVDTDVTGTAGIALTATKAAYLNATTWLLADADAPASSTLPPIGFAVADIANGATGTLRTAGRMTGFSGLTAGSDYYLSGTAGEITATAPANARYVGRADSISSLIIMPNPRVDAARAKDLCYGRLTGTTGVPVTTSDVTAATTIYWAPYRGNGIALYSGSQWVGFDQAQLSIAVPATTNQMYDVFVDYNAGTPALSLTAWTNDTTRATALTTQDGVLVLTGSTGKRYVGSCRTTGVSGQIEDSAAKRYVWNYYHRVPRPLLVKETTVSWTYSLATWRQARATATNQVDVVVGVAEAELDLTVTAVAANDTAVNIASQVGIGEDSTSAPLNTAVGGFGASAVINVLYGLQPCRLVKYPAVGRHFYAWLEVVSASGVTTWYGTQGFTPATGLTGLTGWIEG